jgi:uncharacterized protein (TIGR03382 family)
MLNRTRLICVAAATLAISATARADLLNLDLQDFPDIASRFIDLTYDSMNEMLVADGTALSYDDDGGASEDILNGSFLINANITNTGAIGGGGGTLDIGGNVGGFGASLLTGNLVAFGFMNGGGPLFEFVFEVTGGDLANDYGGVGAQMGVVMGGVNFGGSFMDDFDNLAGGIPGTGTGAADTAPLPAPAALALLLLAGGVSSRRRRSV